MTTDGKIAKNLHPLNINELPKFNHNMMTIKERNAKDLQKAWKKFLRTQNEKEKNKKDEKENQGIAETD